MKTVRLEDLLEMSSVDAPSYAVCDSCGESWYAYWEDSSCPNYCDSEYRRAGVTVRDTLPVKRRDDQYEALCRSLDAEGMASPILVQYNCVYNGHHRITWAVDRGLLEILTTSDEDEYYSAEEQSPW